MPPTALPPEEFVIMPAAQGLKQLKPVIPATRKATAWNAAIDRPCPTPKLYSQS